MRIYDESEARNWATACHLCGLVPHVGLLLTLIIFLSKKEEYEFVADQGKEALNFQLTLIIIAFCLIPLIILIIGIPLIILLGFAGIILSIVGAVSASSGNYYRYPFNFRLIK
ncbi:MAG: DUF4870 domain-containing protein [Bacteroidota bacterium]|nr:DUF4870 domain-containing protein [Bacteroidota bacterium]